MNLMREWSTFAFGGSAFGTEERGKNPSLVSWSRQTTDEMVATAVHRELVALR